MKKKIYFLCICLFVSICACQKADLESETISQETGQSILQNVRLTEPEEPIFLVKYKETIAVEDAKRVALLYLDEDSNPELLIIKNGEYKLYSLDGSEVRPITMPDAEVKMSTYGLQHDFQESEYQTFYWFEYVPYKKLVRVHSSTEGERHDYYLRYAEGSLTVELESKSVGYKWYTYDMEGEIANEDFLTKLSDLGYDELIPCEYLYEDITVAYENIGAVSDTQNVLEDFVDGKIDALDHVEKIGDIPEESFVMRSFQDYFEYITVGDEFWMEASEIEYIDFDNDGRNEMIIHGYTGACLFFDVIGNTVYKVLHTGSTADVASIATIDGKNIIKRTDLTHTGRKYYWIMRFDACGCLIDWFNLHASFEGENYTEEDEFMYREREITMEEFEEIRDSVQNLHD